MCVHSQFFPDEVSEYGVFSLLHSNSSTGWTKCTLTGLKLVNLVNMDENRISPGLQSPVSGLERPVPGQVLVGLGDV